MVRKVFKQMIISQIVSAMAVTICMIIDSIMIGRFIGVDAMAAYGLSSPILLACAALGSMISTGIQMQCGKAMGAGDENELHKCFTVTVLLGLIISAVGVLAIILFSDRICCILGAEPGTEVYRLTKDYLISFIIGAPAFMGAQMLVPFLQLSGNRKRLVVAVAAMAVSDIVGDILNVFVFKAETFGMGIASSVSYFIALGIGGAYLVSKDCMFKFRAKGIKVKDYFALMKNGVPTIVNQVSYMFLVLLINNILLNIGQSVAVAAYSVITSIANLCFCVSGGNAGVALMLAGIFHSEEDKSSLRELMKVQSRYAVILGAAVNVIVFLAAPALIRLFLAPESGKTVIKIAITGVRIYMFCMIPCALNTAFKNYYQGLGRIRLAEIFSVIQNFLAPAFGVLLMSKLFGVTGVWFNAVIGETLTLIIISCYMWARAEERTNLTEVFLGLPKNFGVPENECLEAAITNTEEAADACRKASAFCEERGQDSKICNYVALCIEELTGNIIKYGFREKSENLIELRIIHKADKWVIRLRDNCINFDPIGYMEKHSKDESGSNSHLGVRMMFRLANKVQYVNTLGLNNLVLEL